jgi:hypothetical protein
VGGNTKGKDSNEATGIRQIERVCASHQASGVAMSNKIKVVKPANSSVNSMAIRSCVLRFISISV